MSRRAERLFQIVQILRGRRLTTALQLAERLRVSERTIYRDMQDLSLSSIPVQGEAGVGYRLSTDFNMPPLMFSPSEIEALSVGLRMLKAWGGNCLEETTDSALEKLIAALPSSKRINAESSLLFAPNHMQSYKVRESFDIIHNALNERRLLQIDYVDAQQQISQRKIYPLGLFFFGGVWVLGAWCDLRKKYRSFRIDRFYDIKVLDEQFRENTEYSLNGFLLSVKDNK